jgi:hypothetical protein
MAPRSDELNFDDGWYLSAYPDVANALQAGAISSALEHYLLHGRAEGRQPLRPVRSVAIFTMVYNENVNLPIWMRHYRRIAPTARLFVIDHSSDDSSTDQLDGATRIWLPRDKFDERDRAFLVTSLQQGLLRYYDSVIYTDCDEMLVPNPAQSATIEEHLAKSRLAFASPIGISIIHIVDVEPALDFSQPLLAQRRFGKFHSHLCKPIVSRIPLKWEVGFHLCDRPFQVDRGLYLFHLKQIDRDTALERQHVTQRVKWSDAAVAANHSVHHRYEDEHFLKEFFLEPAAEFKASGAHSFCFDSELARMEDECHELGGFFHIPNIRGPIVELPEALRAAF